jgi:hypothetical protein
MPPTKATAGDDKGKKKERRVRWKDLRSLRWLMSWSWLLLSARNPMTLFDD